MLTDKNAKRVSENKDFSYILEDTERVEKRMKENKVSLKMEDRKKEIAEADLRRKSRNAERLKRFAEIEKQDEATFKMYRLTLDDVNLDQLPEVNLENDSQRHMRQAKDEVADLDDTPEWPSGVDATKREGLSILRDLVGAVKASKLAGVLERGD
jgi:carboxyl-terminal processing protease